MILLHGLFGGLSNWHGVVSGFQSAYDIHIPTLPIFDNHREDRLGYLTDFLHAYIKEHNLRNVILVGNSLGGHVAILYTPVSRKRIPINTYGKFRTIREHQLRQLSKEIATTTSAERVAYTFYNPLTATDALVNEVFRITTDAAKCLSIVRMAKSAQRHYVADLLPNIPAPTLLIWGEDDKITPPRVAYEFKNFLPNAQLVMLPRCGHAPMMEMPEEFNTALQSFLDKPAE